MLCVSPVPLAAVLPLSIGISAANTHDSQHLAQRDGDSGQFVTVRFSTRTERNSMSDLITPAEYEQYASAWVTVSRALDRAQGLLDHKFRGALSLLNTAVNLAERDLAPVDHLFNDVRGATY